VLSWSRQLFSALSCLHSHGAKNKNVKNKRLLSLSLSSLGELAFFSEMSAHALIDALFITDTALT
jgi:hypothetical protein